MSKEKTAIVIRHVAFEDLGSMLPGLDQNGFHYDFVEAGYESLAKIEADLVVILGGPISVYDEDKYPFLRDEINMVERRMAAGKPTLGICLGAQIMARALGERVYPAPVKELGWEPLTLTSAGRDSLRSFGPDRCSMFHWHGDTFDLPKGASLLASTAAVANQAFTERL